ncbi:MAG TPA: class I SAM-dependent methyltransferase [Candidatus Saccharimonadia bacterium]|jgi:SAM-dependent methyltransferase
MSDYDIFAPYYDAVMGKRPDVTRLVRRHIKHHLPEATSILELGCGTGTILRGLAPHFQTVAGIDQSAQMLQVARHKLPGAAFYQGTIAEFHLGRTFDVAICIFDTINHLTDFSDWRSMFSSTREHLNTGGLFIFDMNTTSRLAAVAASPGYVQSFNRRNTFHLRASMVGANTIEWQVLLEIPGRTGAIQVREEYVREASFPFMHVQQALTDAGFKILDLFDPERHSPSDASSRLYFVCQN